MPHPYDTFVEVYDAWTASAPVCEANRRFYVDEYVATKGPVVDLGVGNGRIAIDAARQGKAMVGIDNSTGMLNVCRERARRAGVLGRLQLVEADMRTFELSEPAELITIPYRSIGHLLTLDDKRAALERVHASLVPGGRLIFDAFVFDPEIARQPVLRAEYTDDETGRDVLLWVLTRNDVERQHMRLITWTDELDGDDVVVRRRYRRLDFSWLDPEQARTLLADTGFEVEACYQDFERTPLRRAVASTSGLRAARSGTVR